MTAPSPDNAGHAGEIVTWMCIGCLVQAEITIARGTTYELALEQIKAAHRDASPACEGGEIRHRIYPRRAQVVR